MINMQRNLSIFRVKTLWAKEEWYVLSRKGDHLQEFGSGFFEMYFPQCSKDEEHEFVISIRNTTDDKANLRFEWNLERLRWDLFDQATGKLIKGIYHCDKIPLVFPLAVRDKPNYYKFSCKHLKKGEQK